jgi:hypothetical protein
MAILAFTRKLPIKASLGLGACPRWGVAEDRRNEV